MLCRVNGLRPCTFSLLVYRSAHNVLHHFLLYLKELFGLLYFKPFDGERIENFDSGYG